MCRRNYLLKVWPSMARKTSNLSQKFSAEMWRRPSWNGLIFNSLLNQRRQWPSLDGVTKKTSSWSCTWWSMGKANGLESLITFQAGQASSVARDGCPSWTQKSKLRSGPLQRISRSSSYRWCSATSGAWLQTTCQVVQTTLSKIVLMESSSSCSNPKK